MLIITGRATRSQYQTLGRVTDTCTFMFIPKDLLGWCQECKYIFLLMSITCLNFVQYSQDVPDFHDSVRILLDRLDYRHVPGKQFKFKKVSYNENARIPVFKTLTGLFFLVSTFSRCFSSSKIGRLLRQIFK